MTAYPPAVSTAAGTAKLDGLEVAAQLCITEDRVDVSTNLPQPDADWEFTDASGHWHARSKDGTYPTLRAHVEHQSCDGSCGGVCEGVCEGYDVTHYRCEVCAEEIRPGMRPGPHYASMPGQRSWEIVVQAALTHGSVVNVRFESQDRCWFGVAAVGDVRLSSTVQASRSTLNGIGALGERRKSVVPTV